MNILKEIDNMQKTVDHFAGCGRLTPGEVNIFHRIGMILKMMEDAYVWQEVHHDKIVEENNKLRVKIKELETQNESENYN